jgi:Transposase, Mutator family
MTATLNDVTKKKQAEQSAEARAAVELVRLAKEQGLSLTGPDGLLKQLTKTVLETSLNEEMTEHLGYEKHDPAARGRATSATAPAARRCSPKRVGRWRSTCRVIGRVRLNRRSYASGSAG